MTDNEKRAHDIAVVMLPTLCENAEKGAIARGEAVPVFNAYSVYTQAYNILLRQVEEGFTNN